MPICNGLNAIRISTGVWGTNPQMGFLLAVCCVQTSICKGLAAIRIYTYGVRGTNPQRGVRVWVGGQEWYHSIASLWVPISYLLCPDVYLQRFGRYTHLYVWG